MELSNEDYITATNEFVAEKSPLALKDILNFRLDVDGLTVSTMLTVQTLQILDKKELLDTLFLKKEEKQFCDIIQYNEIKQTPLYYERSNMEFFNDVVSLINQSKTLDRISILLYGPSGSGKTEFAYQITHAVGGSILQPDFSKIQSKWVGETEKNIRNLFKTYDDLNNKSNKPCILLLNEADGLMNKRVSVQTSNDVFANQSQTRLLENLEHFKGIIIATTNLYSNIDLAFQRRFLFKKSIGLPGKETKELVVKKSLISKLLSSDNLRLLCNANWTISQLRNCEFKIEELTKIKALHESHIMDIIKEEGMFNNSSSIGYARS